MVTSNAFVRAALLGLVTVTGAAAQVPQVTTTPQPDRPVITLQEAIRRADEVTPSVVSAEGSVRTAELGIRTAKWAFMPQFTITPQANLALSSGQSRLDPVTQEIISGNTSNPSYGLNIQGTLNLFDGFGRNHSLAAARAREAAADANLVTARFGSRLATTNGFFDALENRELLIVNEAAVARAAEQLRIASARLQSGAGQRTDSLTALVALSQARQALLQAQATLATSEANLGRLVGAEGRVMAAEDQAFYATPAPMDTNSVRQEALAAAPALESSEANLDAARAGLRQNRSTYWPTLVVTANTRWDASKTNDYTLEPRRGLTIGLQLNPWTNFQRETQIENAAIAIDNAEASLADQRRQIAAQLTQYFAALANAQEAIQVAQLSVNAATENLAVARVRYELGVMTIIEFTQIEEQLTQAQVNEIRARFSYLRAKAQIESVVGRTL